MIKLGSKVRDKVSGLVGIAISRTEYINGCIQYSVMPKMKKGAQEMPSWTIDEIQLVSTEPKRKPPGGPTFKNGEGRWGIKGKR